MRKDKRLIDFEKLPKRVQHAFETLVEWHNVIIYEFEKGMYGFHLFDGYDEEYVEKMANTKFKGMRYNYYFRGALLKGPQRIEVIILCSLKRGYGFSIEAHSNDYGFLNNDAAPAHVHVLGEDELEIGMLNISGPCPKRAADIKEFRPPCEYGCAAPLKKTPLMAHRKNLVKWANFVGSEHYNDWEWAQEVWEALRGQNR
jgi:hypothetical protein